MGKKVSHILSIISRHKYLFTIVLFAVLILFIDNNSILSKRDIKMENDSLRREITRLEEECQRDSARLEQLKNDSNQIIRVAREMYFMKRPSEDVYIVKNK